MNIATNIQEWCWDTFYDNWQSDSKFERCKARAAVFLSGAVDGAVIVYPVMLAACIVGGVKIKKLKKLLNQ